VVDIMPVARGAALAFGGLMVGLGVYAARIEPYRPIMRRLAIQVPEDWPRLSILHMSDLHVRAHAERLYSVQKRFLHSIKEQPDFVCVTGDVCETLADAPRAAALLKSLSPRIATLVTLGNHEHDAPIPRSHRTPLWWALRLGEIVLYRVVGPRERSSGTAESRAIVDAFRRAGLTVLVNEGVRLEVGGHSLWAAGIDSTWSGRSRALDALQGRRPDEPCLALIHEPEGAFPFIKHGAALILAGHTHGGQVRMPFRGPVYSHRTDRRIRESAGVQHFGAAQLHISAGLGQNIPLRFNCPPEVAWIDCLPLGTAGSAAIPGNSAFSFAK
jgi:uncharacterized protein